MAQPLPDLVAALALDGARDRTLRDHVCRVMRTAIFDGRLPAGSRIVETQISAALGVSRAPIREAIRLLEREGLLITRAHRDTRVVSPSGAAILDLYAVRAALESYAAVTGLRALRADHLEAMEAELAPLDEAARVCDWERVAVLDAEWHAHIPDAAGNMHLRTVWTTSNGPLRAVFARAAEAVYQPDQVRLRHASLLEVLRVGGPQAIEQAIRDHYLHSAYAFAAIVDGTTSDQVERRENPPT